MTVDAAQSRYIAAREAYLAATDDLQTALAAEALEIGQKLPADIAAIMDIVCERRRTSFAEIRRRVRTRELADTRQIAYWLCRELTLHSSIAIGVMFDREHVTVLSGAQAVADRMQVDAAFARLIHELRIIAEAKIQDLL